MPPDDPNKKPKDYQRNKGDAEITRENKLSLAEQAELVLQQSSQDDEDEDVEHEKEN